MISRGISVSSMSRGFSRGIVKDVSAEFALEKLFAPRQSTGRTESAEALLVPRLDGSLAVPAFSAVTSGARHAMQQPSLPTRKTF